MHYLIVGLGNIGDQYKDTRHNIGFSIVDQLLARAQKQNNRGDVTGFKEKKLGLQTTYRYKGRQICLLKPTTYMNQSGRAVAYWLKQSNLPQDRLLIITDDLFLPFGKLRLRPKGGHGGHNGLRDIEHALASKHYPRLRFGIDRLFKPGQQAAYVLAPFSPKESMALGDRLNQAALLVEEVIFRGITHAMNRYNAPPSQTAPREQRETD